MTDKRVGMTEEEVLLAFAIEPTHDRKTLERYLAEYPGHAEALVDCSVELMMDATRGDEVSLTSEAIVDRAWQQFQTAARQPVDGATANPFARLNRDAFRRNCPNSREPWFDTPIVARYGLSVTSSASVVL